ncbi:hypothetical protein Ahy_A05g023074 isoform B [Arachis hypogaea]|uniref:nicotinate phosphoribosyltransferase n=1 Tax=Arachis hypogaea TaxID=3818 RepID=A0A445D2U4_ARAHY|nr:hypothetical protein Ahy_A05g023074 isoform B [Arachis hypogaea]
MPSLSIEDVTSSAAAAAAATAARVAQAPSTAALNAVAPFIVTRALSGVLLSYELPPPPLSRCFFSPRRRGDDSNTTLKTTTRLIDSDLAVALVFQQQHYHHAFDLTSSYSLSHSLIFHSLTLLFIKYTLSLTHSLSYLSNNRAGNGKLVIVDSNDQTKLKHEDKKIETARKSRLRKKILECSDVEVYAIPEGSVVFPKVPLMRVEVVQLLETPFVNLINYASLVTTNAARHRFVAGKSKTLLEFGLRRAQTLDEIKDKSLRKKVSKSIFKDFVSLVQAWLSKLQRSKSLRGVFAETNQSELSAFISYALAFPNNFLALVNTYDVIRSGIPNFCAVALALNELGLNQNHKQNF